MLQTLLYRLPLALVITRKLWERRFVSAGTLEAVDKAGRKSEKAYQMAKAAAEMKRDIETIITANQGQTAGNATTARVDGFTPVLD
jgi:hypothetical protein